MPYIPITASQREEMLHRLGVVSVDELFEDLPADRRYPKLDLPPGADEATVLRELAALAARDATADSHAWFLGAGWYDHFIPAAVGALAARGEFLTAYTPYQAEASQGTLQATFEFQSLAGDLLGLPAVTAGHYDGATALAEAVLISLRLAPGRKLALVPAGLHPEYRAVLATYLAPAGAELRTYAGAPAAAAAGLDAADRAALACLVSAYPDFFGRLPDFEDAAAAVHRAGGLFIVAADPVMLGLLKSPGELGADLAVAEGQGLGNELSFGGPGLGIMAASDALMRRLPGRLVGLSCDSAGRRAFTLTLTAREQHIRRERASSNICTNQGLMSLRAGIHLALLGPAGLKRAADAIWRGSHYLADKLAAIPGCSVESAEAAGGDFYQEFVLALPLDAEVLADRLAARRIVAGLPLSRYFPERRRELLVCVSELHRRADLDDFAETLREDCR
jgi:glycine dehydrogenase subunit 1